MYVCTGYLSVGCRLHWFYSFVLFFFFCFLFFFSLCCVIGHITRSQGTDMNRTSCVIVMSFICMWEKLTTCVASCRAASRTELKRNEEQQRDSPNVVYPTEMSQRTWSTSRRINLFGTWDSHGKVGLLSVKLQRRSKDWLIDHLKLFTNLYILCRYIYL